jgi:hypothetical protein
MENEITSNGIKLTGEFFAFLGPLLLQRDCQMSVKQKQVFVDSESILVVVVFPGARFGLLTFHCLMRRPPVVARACGH